MWILHLESVNTVSHLVFELLERRHGKSTENSTYLEKWHHSHPELNYEIVLYSSSVSRSTIDSVLNVNTNSMIGKRKEYNYLVGLFAKP